jgi:hypothetical protein
VGFGPWTLLVYCAVCWLLVEIDDGRCCCWFGCARTEVKADVVRTLFLKSSVGMCASATDDYYVQYVQYVYGILVPVLVLVHVAYKLAKRGSVLLDCETRSKPVSLFLSKEDYVILIEKCMYFVLVRSTYDEYNLHDVQ